MVGLVSGLLDQYLNILSSELVEGQEPSTLSESSFRLSSTLITATEGNHDPLKLSFPLGLSKDVTLSLQNNWPQSYTEHNSGNSSDVRVFETRCEAGNETNWDYDCEDALGSVLHDSLMFVSMASTVGENFAETWESSESLSEASVRDSVDVLMVLVGVACGLCGLAIWGYFADRKDEAEIQQLKKVAVGGSFLGLKKTVPRSLRVVTLSTNLISLFFFQAVLYKVNNPNDGSCELSREEAVCVSQQPVFYTGHPKCQSKELRHVWMKSMLLWTFNEVLFVSTLMVVFTHILTPSVIFTETGKIKEKLLGVIQSFYSNSSSWVMLLVGLNVSMPHFLHDFFVDQLGSAASGYVMSSFLD
eukprot:gene9037-8847_t